MLDLRYGVSKELEHEEPTKYNQLLLGCKKNNIVWGADIMKNNDYNESDDELRLSGVLTRLEDGKNPDPAAEVADAEVPQAAAVRSAVSTTAGSKAVSQHILLTEEVIPMTNKKTESEPIIVESDLSDLARLARASANRKKPRKNRTWGVVTTFVILALLAGGVMLEAYMFGKSRRIDKHLIAGPQYALTATTSPQTQQSQPAPSNKVYPTPNQPAVPFRVLHHAPGELFGNNNH